MAIKAEVCRNAGHPWDGRHGFDVLLLNADTAAELNDAVRDAEAKFWQPWLIGTNDSTGKPGGGMYKPCGAMAPWNDSPIQPHPGCTPAMERVGQCNATNTQGR